MVKKPNGVAKGKPAPAGAGASGAAQPSKANSSTPGSARAANFKKRKAKVNREKAAAAGAAAQNVATVGAGTAGDDAPASDTVPQPANVAEASPVALVLKPATNAEGSVPAPTPATDAEGSVLVPMPATAEASASAATRKPKPAAADAAASTSKGKGKGADNSGGDGRMKKTGKERAKERAMNWKGKSTEEDRERKGKGSKAAGKKEERGDSKAAGFIFMCNAKTKQECYQNRLFGLPGGKVEMVKKIKPGARLFLYDFDLKLLYGVYKAASNGGLNIVREAFDGKFPAQVKFKIDKDCLPLPENSFKHAIKENYSARSKFDPELNSRQVHRLIALFKPVNVPQSAPNNRLEERRHYEERRQPYRFDERRPSLSVEELRQSRFDEERRPAVQVPLEDPYRAPRFAPLPAESRHYSLANVQDDHHMYYQPALHAPERRHIPLALESRPLERYHVPSVPEPRHVPPAYYHTLAPSDDSYYQSMVDQVPERYADRSARDPIIPRARTTMPRELSSRMDRLEELYRTGGISTRGAPVEEFYHPGELAVRADRVGIATRADNLEGLYRSDHLAARAMDPPRHSTYYPAAYETNPAYAETSQRPVSARVNASRVPVSSLYSFSGGPVYR